MVVQWPIFCNIFYSIYTDPLDLIKKYSKIILFLQKILENAGQTGHHENDIKIEALNKYDTC